MFENLKTSIQAAIAKIPWQKLAWSVGAAVVSFFVMQYLLPVVLSVKVVSIAGAVAVGLLVYYKVAMWEIERAVNLARRLGNDVRKVVK